MPVVNIDEDLHKRLKWRAVEENLPMTALVRLALEAMLDRKIDLKGEVSRGD